METKHTSVTDAEKRAFAAGWNARETGSGHRADGLESCLGMFERGFNFGDEDTGEDITRRPSAAADLLAAGRAWVEASDAFEQFEREHPNDATSRWDRVHSAKCDARDELRAAITKATGATS